MISDLVSHNEFRKLHLGKISFLAKSDSARMFQIMKLSVSSTTMLTMIADVSKIHITSPKCSNSWVTPFPFVKLKGFPHKITRRCFGPKGISEGQKSIQSSSGCISCQFEKILKPLEQNAAFDTECCGP